MSKLLFPMILVCDLGRVIVDFDPQHDNETFCSHCDLPKDQVRERVQSFFVGGPTFHDYEKCGTKNLDAKNRKFFEAVRKELRYQSTYEDFAKDFCNIFTLNRAVYDLLFIKLRGNPRIQEIWLLSNLNPSHHAYIRSRWPGIFSGCRRAFLSYEMGMRKPDHEIFRAVVEQTDADPNEICFIDDLPQNCAAARKVEFSPPDTVGFGEVIQFEDATKLRTSLVSLDLYIPPD